MITGFHTILYSDDADETRAFFSDVLGWPSIDAAVGGSSSRPNRVNSECTPPARDRASGWATVPFHQSSMMCDDIEATIKELRAKGVTVKGDVEDQGFGLVTSLEIPGAGWMMLDQPRHALVYELTE